MRVFVQPWRRSDYEWKTFPDGLSLHRTTSDRDDYVNTHNERLIKRQRVRNSRGGLAGNVPEEYDYASGMPYWAAVNDDDEIGKDILVAILSTGGYRNHSNEIEWMEVAPNPSADDDF